MQSALSVSLKGSDLDPRPPAVSTAALGRWPAPTREQSGMQGPKCRRGSSAPGGLRGGGGWPPRVLGSTHVHPSQPRKIHRNLLQSHLPAKREPIENYNKGDLVSLFNALQGLVWRMHQHPCHFLPILKSHLGGLEVPSTHSEARKQGQRLAGGVAMRQGLPGNI